MASKRPVIVHDVTTDPRYLTTIPGTRGEMIYAVIFDTRVVGTIDVESGTTDAFSDEDESFLATCADALRRLWR